MNRTFWVLATIAAMGIGSVSAAAAVPHPSHYPTKKMHTVHKAAAKSTHSRKPSAKRHAKSASSKSHTLSTHKSTAKSHAKPMSRLAKRRA